MGFSYTVFLSQWTQLLGRSLSLPFFRRELIFSMAGERIPFWLELNCALVYRPTLNCRTGEIWSKIIFTVYHLVKFVEFVEQELGLAFRFEGFQTRFIMPILSFNTVGVCLVIAVKTLVLYFLVKLFKHISTIMTFNGHRCSRVSS